MEGTLCGVWIDGEGNARVSMATEGGGREEKNLPFRPFAWLGDMPAGAPAAGVDFERLGGSAALGVPCRPGRIRSRPSTRHHADRRAGRWPSTPSGRSRASSLRCSTGRASTGRWDLRGCAAASSTSKPDRPTGEAQQAAELPGDRVLAIGLRMGGKNELLLLDELTDEAEKNLLLRFNARVAALDPDVIEGHNIFKFDLDYLRMRCRQRRVPCAWGRFGQKATFRNSRLKVAERWIDFPRCDLPGRAFVDTYLLALLNDITTRELNSYGLKEVAVHFGITEEDSMERTYIEGHRIAEAYREDRARFCAYLEDDLRETQGLGDLLMPTYFEQARTVPLARQEAPRRGTTVPLHHLFLEEYYHARQSCPQPPEIRPFDGGYTRSFNEGVFRHVLHFDVASLYPSLLLNIGRNPGNDTLGVFIPLLRRLLEYRLRYKQLARNAASQGGARRGTGPPGDVQDTHQLVLRIPRVFGRPLWRRRACGGGDPAR